MASFRTGADGAPTRQQLRSKAYVSPTASVFMDATDAQDLPARCHAIQEALPDEAVFSHLTSASLRAWRMPATPSVPIVATMPEGSAHLDRRGVYVRRCHVPARQRELLDGVRVAAPEWTIVELAEDLGLIDLVAVIDGVLHDQQSTVDRIRDAIVPGRRGAKTLRSAVALADALSESWWESVLRLAHQLAGVPVRSQVVLTDPRGGFVARSDLHIVGTNRYPEYDGREHRDRDRHHRDLRRDKAMAREGHERFGYTADELVSTPMQVVRDAEDALGLARDPARAKQWLHELERSSISRQGWITLQRRLRRFDRTTSPRAKPRVAQDGGV